MPHRKCCPPRRLVALDHDLLPAGQERVLGPARLGRVAGPGGGHGQEGEGDERPQPAAEALPTRRGALGGRQPAQARARTAR